MILPTGDINMEKRNGPRTLPCGTPVAMGEGVDLAESTATKHWRPLRYEMSQFNTVPVTPKSSRARLVSMSWSMVSKAADMSSENRIVEEVSSMLFKMSFVTFKRAVSVECPCLKPDWSGLKLGELMM